MFRKDKDLVERSQTLLKNKEIKQLKTDLSKQFSYFERNQEDLNTLLPNKCNLTCTKLVNRTLLYSLDGFILFFDIEGRNNLFPTIHTLSLYPSLVPTVITWGPVSRFVLRGADFMGPGIASLEGLEGLVEKGKCALRIVGNPVPFAVGVSLKSFAQLSNAVTRKGKAMLVHHSYGDLISPKTPPNAGFTSVHEITPIEQVSDGPKDMGNYDEDEEDSGNEKEGGVDDTDGKEEPSGKLDPAAGDDEEEGESTNELKEEANREKIENEPEEEEDGDEEEAEEEEEGYSIRENDEYLMQTLLITIKYFIKDKQLPLLVSTFWSQLQKSIPDITRPINIKRTSYKKVFSFLVFYCQNELQLLTIVEDDNGIAKLTKITREHSLIKQFKYEKIDELKAMILQRESSSSSDPSNSVKTSGGKKDGSSNQIQVSELYKVPKKLREIFHDLLPAIMASSKYGEYLQLSEVRDLLLQYIKKHDLEIPDKRSHLLITSEDPISEFCDVNEKKAKETPPASRTAALPPPPPPTGYDGMPLVEESNKAVKGRLEDESYVDPIPQISSLSIYDQLNLSGGNEIKLKIHKDGLKNVNDLSDFPALSTSTANSASSVKPGSSGISTSKIAGGSKVGGWGRDPSKPFKPIHLPSPQPVAAKAKPPPSYSPASSQLSQKKDKVGKESGSNVKTIDADEEEVKVHQLSKEEFFKTLVSKLTLYHAIAPPQSDSAEIKSGSIPKIKILTEHRAGNKMVTVVRGMDHYPIDLTLFTKACQKKFACSVSVSSVPGIAKDKEVLIQGNYPSEVEAYLIQNYGLPRVVMEITLAKKKSGKK